MKTSQFFPILLLTFCVSFGQSESGFRINQHFWLLDGFEFPDTRFIRNTFTEPNLNKLTLIIDSKAYAGAGIEYGYFDESLKDNFNAGNKEIFYLKNRCYMDFNKVIAPLPGLLKQILPSACHLGLSFQRDRFSEKVPTDKTNSGDTVNIKQRMKDQANETISISNFGVTPEFFLYWIFQNSIINNITLGIQRTFHKYDPTIDDSQLSDYFEYFFDMYLGKHDNSRNLFRLTFNTTKEKVEGEDWSLNLKADYVCLEYEFQHDFKSNLTVNIGVRAEYQLYKFTEYPTSKIHYVELMPHLSVDYTFPVFLNTISISLFAPRMNNICYSDGDVNEWEEWDKYWSASIYLSMPFWSKPLNIKSNY